VYFTCEVDIPPEKGRSRIERKPEELTTPATTTMMTTQITATTYE
jgi:hypothetical protein